MNWTEEVEMYGEIGARAWEQARAMRAWEGWVDDQMADAMVSAD